MRRQVLLLLFSLFAIVGFAQQRTVTGTVMSCRRRTARYQHRSMSKAPLKATTDLDREIFY